MVRLIVICSFVVAATACGSSDKPAETPAAPAPPTEPAATPSPPAAHVLTPEECTAQGGQVRGDIGDGQIACAGGERELGRVRTGIEGGVCCAPGTPAMPTP